MSSILNKTNIESVTPYSHTIIFRLFVILLIPSLACSFLIFFYFIRSPQLRQQSSNHIILVLLIVLFIEALTDLPIRLYYLNQNTVLIHKPGFCLFWNWIASVLNIVGLHLMALGSVERHLFVFHNQFISRHRLLVSRLPMAICIIYPLVFYTSVIYGSWWCTNSYDYSTLACGAPCYLIASTFYPAFGVVTHHALPVFIILFANVFLIIRVWKQKSRMNQGNVWRKNVRMSAQLLSISFIYLIVWIPQCVLFLLLALASSQVQAVADSFVYEYTGNFTSFTILVCPFVALAGLPRLRDKIKKDLEKIIHIQNNMITPIGANIAVQANNIRTR